MTGFRAQSAWIALMLAAMAPLLAGCEEPNSASAAQASDPDVSFVTVKPQARALVRELPGRVAPTRVSDVRPRVSGIIFERMFDQGSEVKAGDPLYRIDPRPFEVEVQSSEAALAKAMAALSQASKQARRIAVLTSQRATSEAENEQTTGAMRQAEAEVEGRKAMSRAQGSIACDQIGDGGRPMYS
jgi:membrane fusion protein (multidrug efflux system)